MTVIYFARAGDNFPALVLFEPVVTGSSIIASGYIANSEIKQGRKLYQVEKIGQDWKKKTNGLCCKGQQDLVNSVDTFDTRLQMEVL